MAVKMRNGSYYVYFRPFKDKKIGLNLYLRNKGEARRIESLILKACRTGSYGSLDLDSREACVRMFENQGWQLPPDLRGGSRPREELTLWKACELFLKYPEIKASPNAWRYISAIGHLVDKLGKDRPVKSIWVPDLKAYQRERLSERAAAGTINWELATLSKLFGVLIEIQHDGINPVHLVKRLNDKSGERDVYLSFHDVQRIMDQCPAWFRPFVATAYYTGMRRGEILGLTRKQVNLVKRIITLSPDHTKEGHWKRVPIHRNLVPIFEEALKVTTLKSEKVFLLQDKKGVRPPGIETFKNCWPRACNALGLEKPWPRFHDLRHAWRTNARRSEMNPTIAESIMGHCSRRRSVSERYDRISEQDLVQAIDAMTFDHGPTEIFVAGQR